MDCLSQFWLPKHHTSEPLLTNRHETDCVHCMSDTSRLPLSDEEQNEGNYVFVTYETMLADIAMHAYLEYGSYDGALYGTKLDTIQQIHADGLVAVIDVEPQVHNVCTADYTT